MRPVGAAAVLGRFAAVVAFVVIAAACGSSGSQPTAHNRLPSSPQALLHPAGKYFGVSVDGAPASLQKVRTIAAQAHKTPSLVASFSDWTHPFDAAAARNACDAGIVPLLTWESWSWEDLANGSPAFTQPAYAPRRIAAGAYDGYIRSTAAAIKSLGCPMMLRLDQEPNGYWYPWGTATHGMHNTAAQYVAMWRHVWGIFHAAGVHNVIWVWSPNYVSTGGAHVLGSLYPGNKYVDAVGVDGYLLHPHDTPANVFGPTLRGFAKIANNKPWLISETGAAAGPRQPAHITELLHAVASDGRLIGFIYLDQPETRANWTFSASRASLQAFRRGIDIPSYGQALSY